MIMKTGLLFIISLCLSNSYIFHLTKTGNQSTVLAEELTSSYANESLKVNVSNYRTSASKDKYQYRKQLPNADAEMIISDLTILTGRGSVGFDEWHLECRIVQKTKDLVSASFSSPMREKKKVEFKLFGFFSIRIPDTASGQAHVERQDKFIEDRCDSFIKLYRNTALSKEYKQAVRLENESTLFPIDIGNNRTHICFDEEVHIATNTSSSSRKIHHRLGLCSKIFADHLYCNPPKNSTVDILHVYSDLHIENTTLVEPLCISDNKSYATLFIVLSVLFNPKTLFCVVIALSILALCITFSIYISFEQLRNIPGLNNMFLAGNMILSYISDFLSLLIVRRTLTCSILGLTSHYLRLSTIFCSNVATAHMFRVFWLFKPNTGIYFQRRCVIWYMTYVYTMTSLFVGASIVWHHITKEDRPSKGSFGYSDETCFINQGERAWATHEIPECVVLSANIILILLVWIRTWWKPIIQSNTSTNRKMTTFYLIFSAGLMLKKILFLIYKGAKYKKLIMHLFVFLHSSYGMIFFAAFLTTPQLRWLFIFWRLTHKKHPVEWKPPKSNLPKSSSFP